jgi:GMP synthase (glutamine-hydrolysing)
MVTRAVSPLPVVGILVTGEVLPEIAARRGELAHLVASAAPPGLVRFVPFDVRVGVFPKGGECDALVITGSASSVTDREPWVLALEAFLREATPHTPTLGICFGHQVLAQALGGLVTRNPRGREIGTITVERTGDDALLSHLPARFGANATHVDTVARLPNGAVALARSDRDDHQAIRFSPTCFGVQFHPELDDDVLATLVRERRPALLAEGLDPDATLSALRPGHEGRTVLARFVESVAAGARRWG